MACLGNRAEGDLANHAGSQRNLAGSQAKSCEIMRLAAPPMWSHGPLPWPVSTPCSRVSTSSTATSFTTPKCLAKLTSVTIMRSREPRVQRLRHSIRPSSAYNARCKPVPGVHRGGDKSPAKIAESGAAGLRKFEVCVCVCACLAGLPCR